MERSQSLSIGDHFECAPIARRQQHGLIDVLRLEQDCVILPLSIDAGVFPMLLKAERGHAIFLDLVRTADVLIENFRPGTMDDLGIGYSVLAEVNQVGPARQRVLDRVRGRRRQQDLLAERRSA